MCRCHNKAQVSRHIFACFSVKLLTLFFFPRGFGQTGSAKCEVLSWTQRALAGAASPERRRACRAPCALLCGCAVFALAGRGWQGIAQPAAVPLCSSHGGGFPWACCSRSVWTLVWHEGPIETKALRQGDAWNHVRCWKRRGC